MRRSWIVFSIQNLLLNSTTAQLRTKSKTRIRISYLFWNCVILFYLQRGAILPCKTTEQPKTSTGIPAVTKKCHKQLSHQMIFIFSYWGTSSKKEILFFMRTFCPYCKNTHLHYNQEHKELTSQHEGLHCSRGDPMASASEREFQLITTIMDNKWTQSKSFVSFEYFCSFSKSQDSKT